MDNTEEFLITTIGVDSKKTTHVINPPNKVKSSRCTFKRVSENGSEINCKKEGCINCKKIISK